MDSTAILVEAERKFMIKLCNAMTPVMIDAFYEMYKKAIEVSKGRQTLIHYQTLLQEVPHWNNTIVKQHADSIIKTCSMFPNLLAAVFVISVKIMSAVRISHESRKLNIKLPTNDVFVHSCYMAAAKNLYEDPFIVVDDIKESEKRAQLYHRFSKCIQEVTETFIPVQQILETYIPSFSGGELDMDQGVGADPAEVDDEPPAAEGAEGGEAAEDGAENPFTPVASTDPAPQTPVLADQGAEMKEIPVTPVPQPAVHEETLFDDAPDKK